MANLLSHSGLEFPSKNLARGKGREGKLQIEYCVINLKLGEEHAAIFEQLRLRHPGGNSSHHEFLKWNQQQLCTKFSSAWQEASGPLSCSKLS